MGKGIEMVFGYLSIGIVILTGLYYLASLLTWGWTLVIVLLLIVILMRFTRGLSSG